MSDLLELIRKTQPLYNHLPPAEAKILDELVAAVHDVKEQLASARNALARIRAHGSLHELDATNMKIIATAALSDDHGEAK